MMNSLEKLAADRRHGNGKSSGAAFRRDKRRLTAGKIHTGRIGEEVTIGLVTYTVAADGSFRKAA